MSRANRRYYRTILLGIAAMGTLVWAAIDQFVEPPDDGPLQIAATIHVERHGQKRILVGERGSMLTRIGTEARTRIEALSGRAVVLKLWVRVSAKWRDRPQDLQELGYGQPAGARSDDEPG